jgi:hypothetical protein
MAQFDQIDLQRIGAGNAPQGLGLVPMVIEQSGRGERAYDI